MRLYTGLKNYFSGQQEKRFDAQISQMVKVLFCLGACRLSAENGEHASLKSVTNIRLPKTLNRKKKIN